VATQGIRFIVVLLDGRNGEIDEFTHILRHLRLAKQL
jgi:hypothetical protein